MSTLEENAAQLLADMFNERTQEMLAAYVETLPTEAMVNILFCLFLSDGMLHFIGGALSLIDALSAVASATADVEVRQALTTEALLTMRQELGNSGILGAAKAALSHEPGTQDLPKIYSEIEALMPEVEQA